MLQSLRDEALPRSELQARVEAAESGRAHAESLLAEARAQLGERRAQLGETQASLLKAEEQLAASDRLRREAEDQREGRVGGEAGSPTTFAEVDRRVREMRKVAEEQLRAERQRSKEDLLAILRQVDLEHLVERRGAMSDEISVSSRDFRLIPMSTCPVLLVAAVVCP